ncbi:efflux transporter periplasmic adaptor subunit [Photobacterium phosphoreum]|uniref:Efflux transporter periplasmic adaptor subunit n=1 Tax=Photobacterium phosphoreum TaxID=659 RepID=A0A2T3JFQ3_PHOPO|nr:efflux RND transporter periplasmic adaptor subunit [Photobacterium phosphoreum]PSU20031.1 efflux transporter periplasmic adaptor subunit [Photobacterium phosphoreum]PSU36566.1 efflux transporter periplasmic adaptor subunit [Photobacterium phosphoreum]PSU47764.1 efflux transporter periplasmic adaptor subunit [Photobacterium phosphoreum]
MKKMVVAVLVAAVLSGSYFYFQGTSHAAQNKSQPERSQRVVAVTTGEVASVAVAQSLSLVGKLHAEQAVNVAAEVSAKIKMIAVPVNTTVTKGQLLIQLDDDKAVAAYDEALAYRNDEQRKLTEFQRLLVRGAITKTEIDAQAASVSIANARLKSALANLNDHAIRAPFNGTIGLYDFSPGHMTAAGSELFNFDDLSSMRLDIEVPEQYISSLKVGINVTAKSQAWGDRAFVGKIQAIDSRVQPDSLNIKVRVVFENSDHALKPGMLLATDIDFIPQQQAIIPVQALEYSGTKRYVYIVDNKQKVHRTLVELGERIDNNVVIKKGIKTGERIVVQGLVNMRDGIIIKDITVKDITPAAGVVS